MIEDLLHQPWAHHVGQIGHERWWGWPLTGIGTSWIAGLWAQVDGTSVVNLIALGIVGIGSSCIGLWRLYEVQRIRIEEERRRSKIRTDEEARASLARVPRVTIVSPGTTPDPDGPAPS